MKTRVRHDDLELDLGDIQAHFFPGFGGMGQAFLFCRVVDRAAFLIRLSAALHTISTASSRFEAVSSIYTRFRPIRPDVPGICVAFSARGLEKLGERVGSYVAPFVEGMSARTRMRGPPPNPLEDCDVVFIVAAQTAQQAATDGAQLIWQLTGAVELLRIESGGASIAGKSELGHLGFADPSSQPYLPVLDELSVSEYIEDASGFRWIASIVGRKVGDRKSVV